MKSALLLTMSCFVALSAGCDKLPAGNFCDIAKPDVYASKEVAGYMVANDTKHVQQDIAENEYGAKHCGWGAVVALPSEGN